jgi:hypothetical protein
VCVSVTLVVTNFLCNSPPRFLPSSQGPPEKKDKRVKPDHSLDSDSEVPENVNSETWARSVSVATAANTPTEWLFRCRYHY